MLAFWWDEDGGYVDNDHVEVRVDELVYFRWDRTRNTDDRVWPNGYSDPVIAISHSWVISGGSEAFYGSPGIEASHPRWVARMGSNRAVRGLVEVRHAQANRDFGLPQCPEDGVGACTEALGEPPRRAASLIEAGRFGDRHGGESGTKGSPGPAKVGGHRHSVDAVLGCEFVHGLAGLVAGDARVDLGRLQRS